MRRARPPRRHAVALALTLVAGAGCDEAPSSRATSATTSATVVPEQPSVAVLLNGQPAARIPLATLDGQAHTPLHSQLTGALAERSKWQRIAARSDHGARLVVDAPSERLRNREVAFFRGPDGQVALGVFRVVPDHATPALRALAEKPALFVHDVREIAIWTVPPPKSEAEPKPGVKLQVAGQDRVVVLDHATLMQIPRVSEDRVRGTLLSGRRGEVDHKKHVHQGWELRRVMKGVARPHDIARVTLVSHKGQRSVLDPDALAREGDDAPLLIRNDRGAVNVHFVTTDADGKRKLERARDLTSIDVTLKDGAQ